jgi:HPt (histidine-containing phosphotransfer) domain-containing protein
MNANESNSPPPTLDPALLETLDALARETGDTALVERALQAFFDVAQQAQLLFRESVSAGDWQRATFQVHSIKGAAGQLGARRLFSVCEQIERACRAGDVADPLGWAAQIEREVDEAQAAMRRFSASRR